MFTSKTIKSFSPFINIKRNTWVLRRLVVPESTPVGKYQRNPNELPELQRYEVVENKNTKPAGDIRVILLCDVEGVGYQFDVLNIGRKLARTDLLLTGKAAYASPFDLQYYAKMKESMKDELSKRVRIPYEYVKLRRELQKLIIPINVSMENEWKLNNEILICSLRYSGINVQDDCISILGEEISGPNFEIEGKIVDFNILINNEYSIPMKGKISHISTTDKKQMLYP
uniref:Large ribosomal subunit protein bL9m n=1 Tax=Strongyloides venezuelensis TaxID=75913 RepID=A0A0K0F7B5_STRVS